ncbi:MAG: LamG domain-containing protein [Phycisphaerae bacterium]|nr:LamG domain-containing protein [Phycisphaerae bacterium]
MTGYRHHKQHQNRCHTGTTLVELVMAISMMAIILTTLIPLIRSVRLTWEASENNAERLQNGRILVDHLSLYLASAASIESVSSSGDVLGYLQFKDYEDTTFRYAVNESGYVEYGEPNAMNEIAGPVSQFQLTCYDGNDLSSPITDVNAMRLIHVDVACTSSIESDQDMTFTTSIFINTDRALTTPFFEGWWCMDDDGGKIALDSSGHGRDGTLMNMQGNEWTTGVLGGALELNGSADYVDLPIGSVIETATDCTVAAWVMWSGHGDIWQRVFDFGTGTTKYMMLTVNDGNGEPRFSITDSGSTNDDDVDAPDPLSADWHHMAVTIDSASTTITLYIDGEAVAQNTSAQYTPSDLGETTQNWLGKSQYTYNPNFNGILDDVRLYSRALSAEEISDLVSDAHMVIFKDFKEAKLTKNKTSLNIHTPCKIPGTVVPVSMLGSWTTGLTHTAPSGQNRVLIVTAHAEAYGADVKLDSMTYGGQAMTKVRDESKYSPTAYAYVVAYMLDEAGIAAATSNTLVPTWNSPPDYVGYSSVFLENVDQITPIGDTEKKDTDWEWTLSTNELVNDWGDMAILAGTAGNTGTYWVNNGFTEALELSITSSDGVVGYVSTNGNDVIPSISHSNPFLRQVLVGLVVKVLDPAPITSIEGDLLIAAVAVDGLETISAPSGGGWTLLSHGDGAGKITFGVWAKLAAASEPASHTFTWNTDEQAYGWIMRFQGHDPANPIDVMDSKDLWDDSTPPCPSVTTTVNHAMILRLGGFDEDDIYVDDTGLSGHTTITMDTSKWSSEAASGGAAYMYQLEAGNTGAESFVLSRKEEYRTVTLAIAPAPPASSE